MPRAFCTMSLVVLLGAASLLGSCGSSGLPTPAPINVQITPAQASASTGTSTGLKGSATGLTVAPVVQWWIQESQNDPGGDNCGYLTLPATSPCPYGYVVFGSVTDFPSSATYYAPSTPGTYHVVFKVEQDSTFDHVSKTATAAITVTQ